MRFVSLREIRHARHLTTVPINENNCGFVYLMRLPGTDVYKIGYATFERHQEIAVQRRYKTLHKELNKFLFPDGTRELQLDIVGLLHVTKMNDIGDFSVAEEFARAILMMNEKKNTTDWLDFSADGAENRWHKALLAFRVRSPRCN